MEFTKQENELYSFYESLSFDEMEDLDKKLFHIIPELRKNGVNEGDIYELKCIVAKDVYKHRGL